MPTGRRRRLRASDTRRGGPIPDSVRGRREPPGSDHHAHRRPLPVGAARQGRSVGNRRVRLGIRGDAPSPQVLRDGSGLEFGDAALLFGSGGDASRRRPPVVEDLGEMGDAAAALRQSEHQLEVLDPVEGGVEAASLAHQRGACHEQMADVHRAECVHRRPVRLVKGGEPTPAAVELVLVGVEEVGRRVRLDRGGDHLQRVGRKRVVVVEECDVLATGHRHSAVRRRRDPGVALGEVDPDPIVLGSCLLEHLRGVRDPSSATAPSRSGSPGPSRSPREGETPAGRTWASQSRSAACRPRPPSPASPR